MSIDSAVKLISLKTRKRLVVLFNLFKRYCIAQLCKRPVWSVRSTSIAWASDICKNNVCVCVCDKIIILKFCYLYFCYLLLFFYVVLVEFVMLLNWVLFAVVLGVYFPVYHISWTEILHLFAIIHSYKLIDFTCNLHNDNQLMLCYSV